MAAGNTALAWLRRRGWAGGELGGLGSSLRGYEVQGVGPARSPGPEACPSLALLANEQHGQR